MEQSAVGKTKKKKTKRDEGSHGLRLAEDLGNGSGAVLEDVGGDHGVDGHVGGEVQGRHRESSDREDQRSQKLWAWEEKERLRSGGGANGDDKNRMDSNGIL